MSDKPDDLQSHVIKKYGSKTAFAAAARVPRCQVYRALAGKGLNLTTAIRMAGALDITLDEFAGLVCAQTERVA